MLRALFVLLTLTACGGSSTSPASTSADAGDGAAGALCCRLGRCGVTLGLSCNVDAGSCMSDEGAAGGGALYSCPAGDQ